MNLSLTTDYYRLLCVFLFVRTTYVKIEFQAKIKYTNLFLQFRTTIVKKITLTYLSCRIRNTKRFRFLVAFLNHFPLFPNVHFFFLPVLCFPFMRADLRVISIKLKSSIHFLSTRLPIIVLQRVEKQFRSLREIW